MQNFALIGGAGYIAPEHIKAIRDTGNNLAAVLDPNDNLEALDDYFPECEYFREMRTFNSFVSASRNTSEPIDVMVICSPNYLHYEHVCFALESNCDAICECPLVLKTKHLKELIKVEQQTGHQVYPFLQFKYHPWVVKFKEKMRESDNGKIFDVKLTNITSRGKWYQKSWKNDPAKSGGLTTVLGFHYFELLISLFGKIVKYESLMSSPENSSGTIVLEKANVDWFFSINSKDLPNKSIRKGERKFVQLMINNNTIDLNKLPALFYTTYYGILRNHSVNKLGELEPLIGFLQRV
ncbi:MAG: Gfo/Idh/MocA family protein [Mangrovibacterium sp.]